MATIREIIRNTAAEQLPDWTYLFEDWTAADARMEKLTYPAILCVVPTSGQTEIRNGRIYDNTNIAIAFLDAVPRGADGDDNGAVIDSMKVAGAKFIRALTNSHALEQLDNKIPYETIIERMSSIVSGVMYSLQLCQKIGDCSL